MNSKIVLVARVFLGLVFVVFGLNGFLNFIPLPTLPEPAMQFMGALGASGYFFPVLKITEIICGLAILSNKFSALALVVLAPISIQIALFHAFLTPGPKELIFPILIIAAHLCLARSMKEKYAPLLTH